MFQLCLSESLDLRPEGGIPAFKGTYRKRVLIAMVAMMMEVAIPQFKSAERVTSSSRDHSSSP